MNYCYVSHQADDHAADYGRQQAQQERMGEEFAKRMGDAEWIVDGLRNLLEREERLLAVAIITGDECQAGKLLDIAVRRHVMETVKTKWEIRRDPQVMAGHENHSGH